MDWSTFKEDAKKTAHKGPLCSVAKMLNEDIPASERPTVEKVIEDPSIQAASIARALQARLGDKAPSRWSVANHRRGECRCHKEQS